MGIAHTVNVQKTSLKEVMNKLGMIEGFDIGLEMSGSAPAFSDMIDTMNNGGRIALLGILPSDTKIAWDKVIFKGLKLKGIYGREMYETWYKMTAMIQSGLNIKPIFTHQFPVVQFQEAFEIGLTGNSGKIILDWSKI